MHRVHLTVAALLVVVAGAACQPVVAPPPAPPAPPSTPPGAIPSGLPAHFGIGLSAQPPDLAPAGWVAGSGIPFDYAYQYLAGGVNTGGGWQTWNASAQFPLWYAQDARSRGAIPVFPYYMLFQSNSTCGACGGEAAKDLANLNDSALMASYYADFAKLMQRLGTGVHDTIQGYGGVAVVHVEPDLSGYAQQAVLDPSDCYGHCTGTGNNPDLLRAAVASSGYAPVSGYADTWRGFNSALLHLRDLYAPNVKLAYHVSTWTTGRDIGSDTDPTLDATAHGNLAGAFAAASGVSTSPAGVSTYDLVFNDVADRDAGYYKYVVGRDVWWDRENVNVPNFHRWEQFLDAISTTTARRVIVWQVPLGNQLSRSVNNTDGHYQDNRAEYFFAHVSELVGVGVIAVLYGRGNGGSTTNFDDKGDGVTNPAPTCTNDGTSGPPICTSQVATVADDDGGYLRSAASAYYSTPVALP